MTESDDYLDFVRKTTDSINWRGENHRSNVDMIVAQMRADINQLLIFQADLIAIIEGNDR